MDLKELANASVDLVTCCQAIHWFDDIPAFYAEVHSSAIINHIRYYTYNTYSHKVRYMIVARNKTVWVKKFLVIKHNNISLRSKNSFKEHFRRKFARATIKFTRETTCWS